MSDKELLELAAKAAGYVFLTNGQVCSPEAGNFDWNPLTDDADALRLAVRLEFTVATNFAGAVNVGHTRKQLAQEEIDSDPYVATRRAIVRAAAEIGKKVK